MEQLHEEKFTEPDKSLTTQQINELNEEQYNRRLLELSDGKHSSIEEEAEFYLSGKRISRTEALKFFCKHTCFAAMPGAPFDKTATCPSRTEKGRVRPIDDPEFCPFVYWNDKGSKYTPKRGNHPKMTQKKAIAQVCKNCQQAKQYSHGIKFCTAFWDGDKLGSGCPLHPYRHGTNPWYLSDFTEEEREAKIALMRERSFVKKVKE